MQSILHDTLLRLSRKSFEEALRDYRAGNQPAALEHLRQAHGFNAQDPDITLLMGMVHEALGNPVEAEKMYRETISLEPTRLAAYLQLADVLRQQTPTPARLEEAATLLTRGRELRGNDPEVIVRQARVAMQRNRKDEAERFYNEVLARARLSNELQLELGDFYRELAREEEALAWYNRVRGDPTLTGLARERIRALEVERQARAYGWARPSREVPARARALESRARELMPSRRFRDAEALLEEALSLAPQFTPARMALGDVLRLTGRPAKAEVEYLRAISFDPNHADALYRLGELMLSQSPPRATEAAVYLTRALQLRPDRREWNLTLARALRLSGDLPGALQRVNMLLAGDAPEQDRREAQLLKNTLQKLLPHADEPPPQVPAEPVWGRLELVERLNRARAYLARAETDAAVAELLHIPPHQQTAEVRTLMGRIMHAAGRLEDAADAFEASLALDEAQADVQMQLGLIRMEQGRLEEARERLLRARQQGDADAPYHLARLEMLAWQHESADLFDLGAYVHLWRTRSYVQAFLRSAPETALRDDAETMLDRAWRELLVRLVPLLILLFLAARILLIGLQRRFGGTDLKTLIAVEPETGPEVQQVLAAIRHEVLKHNTMVLSGLVEAMEDGEDVRTHAVHLQETLMGMGGEPGVQARLEGYMETLRTLGRAHGLRLNLEYKDRALRAIYAGFNILRRMGPTLAAIPTLSRWRRALLVREMKRAARLLNTEGYEAVRALLDELRVLRLDESVLRAIHARTCREPAIKALKPLPLDLTVDTPLPLGVCLPRGALEDVLGNLFRNALQASAHAGVVPQVGLKVDVEVNPITGHERLRLFVRDRAPQKLELQTILAQGIEGGLGLTAGLVARYDGTLDVGGPQDGWTKAVVVKLPLDELTAPQPLQPVLEAGHV